MASGTDFDQVIREALDRGKLSVIVAHRPCILAAPKIRQYEKIIIEKKKTAESGRQGSGAEAP